MQEYCIKTSSNICFGYLLESPHWGDSNKYPKHNVLWGNKNKTRPFLHIILSIKDSLKQQILYNGNIFGNKCCCNEGSLYLQHEKSMLFFSWSCHHENTPIQIYRKFHLPKLKIFRYKNSDIFHISAQNIDCGYSLEPPRRGGSNEYPQSMLWAEIWKIM